MGRASCIWTISLACGKNLCIIVKFIHEAKSHGSSSEFQ